MTTFEKKIYDSCIGNSLLFLKETLGRLMNQDTAQSAIDKDLLTLSCAELQISLELAIRAAVIHHAGIAYVLKPDQKKLTEERIIEHYTDNTIKVEDFDMQKNLLKSRGCTSLHKEDFKTIDRFQRYRNKIVHLCCEFEAEEMKSLRDDILYYVVNVVLRLLGDASTGETPAEFLQSKLGYKFYDKLQCYEPYVKAVEKYAQKEADPLWTCIRCSHRTYSPEWDFCFCCGYETLAGYRKVDCGACGTKGSVIYDNLNIHIDGNNHIMNGRCLDCGEDTSVFECPVCGEAHDMSLEWKGGYCSSKHCIHEEGSPQNMAENND